MTALLILVSTVIVLVYMVISLIWAYQGEPGKVRRNRKRHGWWMHP